MKVAALALMMALAVQVTTAQTPTITSLLSRDLPDHAGKELLLITVDYPPGAVDPVHTHDAYAMVYVLAGSVVMQVQGQAPVTLTAGQTFSEKPGDVHVVARNASKTIPAKFVVFFLKKKGAQVLTPTP